MRRNVWIYMRKNLLDEWMSIAKIDTIPHSLWIEQIEALWITNLIHKNMTHYKIEYIWNNFSTDEIIEKWWSNLVAISLAKLVLSEEKYNLIWKLLEENNTKAVRIHAIEKKLSIEQIIILWIENIIKEGMDVYRITTIWDLSDEQIIQLWWKKILSFKTKKDILSALESLKK